jgi:integrase
MASIKVRKLACGERRYDVRYRAPDGTARMRTFKARRDADRFQNTVEADKIRGSWVDPRRGRVTLEEYAKEWLSHRPQLRERTRETYEAQLRLHIYPKLGATEIAKISATAIRAWYAQVIRDVSASQAAKCYRLLRTILATAVTDELIVRNPCRIEGAGVERSAERPQATPEQVFQLADAVPEQYRALILLAGFVGPRVGELLGLRSRHVDLLHGTLTIEQQEQQLTSGRLIIAPPKTDAGIRTLALPAFLVPELERHLSRFSIPGADGRVFPGNHGGPLRRQVLQKHWVAARKKVGLPTHFHFHDLRHTANTLAASTGASLRELMYRMGHASPQAALRYQHATRERDEQLAQSLDALLIRSRTYELTTEPAALRTAEGD